jgi:hypothetical protein
VTHSTFLRLVRDNDKGESLVRTVRAIRENEIHPSVYHVDQAVFETLPDAPFAYWLPDAMRRKFRDLPRLEGNAGEVRQGLATADDFRFVRAYWEVSTLKIGTSREETFHGHIWVPFVKGGEYEPYYSDIHLLVNWGWGGSEIKTFTDPARGRTLSRPQNITYYFRPGLTFPRRTRRICPKALPAGTIFSHGGQACFPLDGVHPASVIGLLASKAFFYLLKPYLPREDADPQYEVGELQRIPVPDLKGDRSLDLSTLTERVVAAVREARSTVETARFFIKPGLLRDSRPTSIVNAVAAWRVSTDVAASNVMTAEREIDAVVYSLYGFGERERQVIEAEVRSEHGALPEAETAVAAVAALLSWAVGVAIGRFDVRLATGERPIPELRDPFAPLPAYAPGMLPEGKVPPGYRLEVAEDGILVDDEGHEWDVVERVREVFHLVFRENAEAIEREACEILGVESLRDYLTLLGVRGFWDDHVKRYSKSRRRAPIYWLLQSPRGHYSAWVYYHRLNRDTLPKLLGPRYLGSKIQKTRHAIAELRPGGQTKPGITKQEERRLAELDELLVDLEEFGRRIRAVIGRVNDRGEVVGYDPDLDDGVVLNAAPLHDLIPWPRRKKVRGRSVSELAAYWEELSEGKYDWAHVAMRYWPTRVTGKCKQDRSLALAHGLDREFFPGLREELRRQAETAATANVPDDDLATGEDDDEEEA